MLSDYTHVLTLHTYFYTFSKDMQLALKVAPLKQK